MSPGILLVVYCLLIIIASVAGGRLSTILRMTHLRTQLLMSGVGGLMLGIAMLHLLPHGGEILQSGSKMGIGGLIGLIVMFLLIRLFHTHDHGVPVEDDAESEGCSHNHPDGSHDHDHHHHDSKGLSWAGLFFGLALHTLVDGVALASSVLADAQHGAWLGLAGLGTFLAVALHKPLDAFAITSVMNKQNWSPTAQNIANFSFSLACPIGAACFYVGATQFAGEQAILGWGLAISGGFFLGIALADLLPEVAFHDHDRGKLTAALLLGVGLAVVIENLPGHSHGPHPQHSAEHAPDEDHVHDHGFEADSDHTPDDHQGHSH
ncbi:ZIP family metal transporter [Novipirellula artificiosorum]|uniref:Zinc transporter ZupT n=1 Tax=Novipirellula artificiosorum TaxID=2528016 RepID=A0A5C6DT48_9BACT|nr:ZIP family metal transporter [Novipirellula artificiosorum]TWU40493.1 zinc transporter ZupT [Novipirellula artificiosorum]